MADWIYNEKKNSDWFPKAVQIFLEQISKSSETSQISLEQNLLLTTDKKTEFCWVEISSPSYFSGQVEF